MTAMDETMGRAPRARAVRAAVGRRDRQVAGRHERRVRLVEAAEQPARANRGTGTTRIQANRGTGGTRVQATRSAGATRARANRGAGGTRVQATRGAGGTRVQATNGTGVTQVRATRTARSRHAARAGWVERARQLAGQARAWWAEGTERVGAGRGSVGGRGTIGQPAPTPAATVAPGAVVGPVRAVGGRAASAGSSAAPQTTDPARQPTGPTLQATEPTPRHLAAVGRRASCHPDLVTGWCSLLLVLGLFLDGTAWRGVLFLGFAGTAGWILTREQRAGDWSLRAVPSGYRVGLVGVGLAMVAVAGDAGWHALAGAAEPGRQELGRLVAPFHLVLFGGVCLLAGSVLRAAWSGPSPARVAGLRAFWPVVLAASVVAAMAAFLFQDVSPLVAPAAGTAPVDELAGLLVHNLLFVAPMLLLLLRWQTPLGTFTVMAGSVAVVLAALTAPGLVGLAGAAVLGGAAADAAVALLRPSPQRRWAARAVAVIAPAVYWTAHVAVLGAGYGAGWEPVRWLGSVLWASLSGFALAVLMWPPAVPLTAWNRGRTRPPSTTTPTAMPARMVGR